MLSGRGFTDRDRAGAPRVVVVNEALAGRLAERFKMTNPVGQIGRLTAPAYENRGQLGRQEDVEIVGVIRNERVSGLQTAVEEVVYVPLAQAPRRELKLIVRTRGDAAAVMPAVREAVREIDPRLPLGDVRTMNRSGSAAWPERASPPG